MLALGIDKFAVWYIFGAESLAFYVVAVLIANEAGRIIDAMSVIILPFLAEAHDDKNIKSLLRSLPAMFGILALSAAIGAILIPYVFPIIFPLYVKIIPLTQLSFLLLIFTPINSILYKYLVSEMWRKKMLALHALRIVVFLAVMFIVIANYELYGVLGALITSEAVATAFLLILIIKNVRRISTQRI